MKTELGTLTSSRVGVFTTAVLLLSACSNGNEPLNVGGDDRIVRMPNQQSDDVYPQERPFWNLAQAIPSSAGFFIDTVSMNVVVQLTNPKDAEVAKSILRTGRVLSRARARNPRADVVVRQARYTFVELREWRDRLMQATGVSGFAWLDLDEVKNRVVIGVEPGTRVQAFRRLARELAVPQEAVEFEVDGPAMDQELLTDSIRPIEGGTKIEYDSAGHIFGCTLGFAASWNGDQAFVTASHCSSETFTVDSTRQYQPKFPRTPADSLVISPIGFEVADDSEACPPGVNGTACARADAAVYRFTGDLSQWTLGRIARPTFGCFPGPCVPANLQIDSTAPYFVIDATKDDSIVVGDLVSKIGIGTGWSQGNVQKSCMQIKKKGTSQYVLCQEFTNYGSGEGDSGAPVLLNINPPPDSSATLGGLHWGKTPNYAVFGPWTGIVQQYPSLLVH